MKRKRLSPLPDRIRQATLSTNANKPSRGRRLAKKRKLIHHTHEIIKTTGSQGPLFDSVIESYQHSSVVNSRFGARAIVCFLRNSSAFVQEGTQQYKTLLDVGAIHGNTFASLKNVKVDAIDLNPRSPCVRKQGEALFQSGCVILY